MDLETFRWLLTDDGQAVLAAATSASVTAETTPGATAFEVQKQLRAVVSTGSNDDVEVAARTAAALGQVELRRHGAAKLGDDAAVMFFTREALEQATRARVAAHRAARVAVAGPSVVDLTCGIGGDLIAFARAGLTTAGVDLDPLRVEMARANLAALGLGGAVGLADAVTLDVAPFGTAYADPGRRTGKGRSFHADDWTPPWTFVEALLRGRAVVKAAPGIPHSLVPDGVEAEWVSDAGEVKEAVLWSPALATARRRATVIGRGGLATLTEEDDPGAGTGQVGGFLYEPDGAVIRAGLVTAVAAGVDGRLLDPKIAYVTGDAPFRTPFATSYRVVEELPYREKQLRAALRERGIGPLTIKKRGVDVVPEDLRKRLGLHGDAAATIVLTRVAGEGAVLLVEPL